MPTSLMIGFMRPTSLLAEGETMADVERQREQLHELCAQARRGFSASTGSVAW